jgi:hypothetical protein
MPQLSSGRSLVYSPDQMPCCTSHGSVRRPCTVHSTQTSVNPCQPEGSLINPGLLITSNTTSKVSAGTRALDSVFTFGSCAHYPPLLIVATVQVSEGGIVECGLEGPGHPSSRAESAALQPTLAQTPAQTPITHTLPPPARHGSLPSAHPK